MLFDWVIAVEDDIELAPDAIEFVMQVHERYKNKKMYRGINLGSLEAPETVEINTYSLLSYGIHGQASAIPRKTWSRFNSGKAVVESISSPLDSLMESFLKTGFMVTPNRSRFKDNGWNGTHAPKDPKDSYYKNIEDSWTGYKMETIDRYIRVDHQHTWRSDARGFTWFTPLVIYVISLRLFILNKLRSFWRINP
jgi:hypothetical protein